MPEAYGGQGGDYSATSCSPRSSSHSRLRRAGDGRRRAHRHGDAADPRSSAPRSRSSATSCRRSGARRSPASASPSPTPARTSPASGRAPSRDGDEWVINGSKTYITNGHRADFIVLVTKTDPDAGYDGFTLFLVDMDLPGVVREKQLEKLGMHASDTALLAFQDVRVPDARRARPARQGLLPHHVGAPGRAADRRRGLRRGRPARVRPHARLRARAQGVRPRDRPLPGDPPQVRRDGDQDRGRAPARLHDRLALRQRRVPGARDLDGQAARRADVLSRSPTSACRSTAARATCASTGSSARGATCA